MGCFEHFSEFDYGPIVLDDLTPAVCVNLCSDLYFPYAAVKKGNYDLNFQLMEFL